LLLSVFLQEFLLGALFLFLGDVAEGEALVELEGVGVAQGCGVFEGAGRCFEVPAEDAFGFLVAELVGGCAEGLAHLSDQDAEGVVSSMKRMRSCRRSFTASSLKLSLLVVRKRKMADECAGE
jgi:hypothetical protein